MREKLEKLSLVALKQIAKELGLKNVSTLKKSALIDVLSEADGIESKISDDASSKSKTELEDSKEMQENKENDDQSTDGLKNETQDQKYERYEKHITRYVAKDNKREGNKTYYNNRENNRDNYRNNRFDRTNRFDKNTDNRNDNRYDSRFEEKNPRNYTKPAKAIITPKPLPNYDVKLEEDEVMADGILEVINEGYGFIRCENFLPGDNDVYVSPTQIRKFNLKTGDILTGPAKQKNTTDKFRALQYLVSINGLDPSYAIERPAFEKLTPIFPNERIHLEPGSNTVAMRMVDLISPIGKGQRGMIVSQPKSGKTTLLKQVAKAVVNNNPEMHLLILLIDERPEEVTDMKESIKGDNVEVIYSTFDEQPDNHRRVSEMVIERAKRLVEQQQDVIILLDSITRLARAYNLTVQASGRTLSGGLDPAALHMPKKFFGAARNMREGGSLTILATALVDTGSKMDDVVFEEFKGTGNMELVLDRKLSERRVFPAIDVIKSSTRREDLLLDADELEAVNIMRKGLNGQRAEESAERVIDLFYKTKNNSEFVNRILKDRYI